MSDVAARLLSALVAVLLTWAAGYWTGDHNRNNAWLASQATVEREAHAKYEAEVERGQFAAANYLDDSQKLQNQYQTLEGKFHELRKNPLLVATGSCPGARLRSDAAAAVGLSGSALAVAAQPGQPQVALADPVADPQLSLAAVRVWNSALAGADLPAGTCGPDAATSEACSLASGLTLGDAWDNHQTNARSCAQDRLRYQALIDFLTQGKTP